MSMPSPKPQPPPGQLPDILLATEVADYLRVSYSTVIKMTHAGDLPAIRVGREFRYLRAELDRLLRQPAAPRRHPDTDRDGGNQAGAGTGTGDGAA
jgi:excisionase family DNA binding protein